MSQYQANIEVGAAHGWRRVQSELQPLYDYLAGRGSFVNLDNYRPEYLPIFSRDVLRRIAANNVPGRTWSPSRSPS